MTPRKILFSAFAVLCYMFHSEGFIADSTEICDVIKRIDCASHYQEIGQETLCGTDGKTYVNRCFYVKAKCKDIHIQIVHNGSCDHSPSLLKILTGSTTKTASHLLYQYNVSETFCKDDAACPDTMDPLCGTDDVFYLNLCEFSKAKCHNKDLHIQTLSNCKDKHTTAKHTTKHTIVKQTTKHTTLKHR